MHRFPLWLPFVSSLQFFACVRFDLKFMLLIDRNGAVYFALLTNVKGDHLISVPAELLLTSYFFHPTPSVCVNYSLNENQHSH